MRARDLLATLAILTTAITVFFSQARPAAALPSGIQGWCTIVGPGTEECGFVSAPPRLRRERRAVSGERPDWA